MFRSPDRGSSIPPHLLAAAMGRGGGGGREGPRRFVVPSLLSRRREPVVRTERRGSVPASPPEHPNTEHLRTVYPGITQEGVREVSAINEVLASDPLGQGLQIGEPIPEPAQPLATGKESMPATLKWLGPREPVEGGYPFGSFGEERTSIPHSRDASQYRPSRETAWRLRDDGEGDWGPKTEETKALLRRLEEESRTGEVHNITSAHEPIPREQWSRENQEAYDNYKENQEDK